MRTLRSFLDEGWATARRQVLCGGMISTTARLTRPDGSTVVVKQTPNPPPGLYAAEAQGLRRLERSGAVRVPRVLDQGEDFLVLSDLGDSALSPATWENLGADIAQLHLILGERFGLGEDNFLGRLPQHNWPEDDGHVFFGRQRLMRYLTEPLVISELDTADLVRLERLAERLPQLVPAQPPSLLHGDLWYGNVLAQPGDRGAIIDPACYYGWAEADLSMLWCCGRVPPSFWHAYQGVRPLDDEWEQRMPLLHLREHLSTLAHFGATSRAAADIRQTIRRYQ